MAVRRVYIPVNYNYLVNARCVYYIEQVVVYMDLTTLTAIYILAMHYVRNHLIGLLRVHSHSRGRFPLYIQ